MSIEATDFTYIPGQMSISRNGHRFTLEGNWAIGSVEGTDHMQLIYEALEIAAHSNDKFKKVFEAFVTEYMELTATWDD